MFAELPRRDQRATGELYLRGLMLDGQRKSMQPMGERLGCGPPTALATALFHQLGHRTADHPLP